MNIGQALQSHNKGLMQVLTRTTNLSENELNAVINQLLPVFSKGVKNATQDQTSAHQLFDRLETDNSKLNNYIEHFEEQNPDEIRQEGENFLGMIFKDKQVSRDVAQKVSEKTGVNDTNVKQTLPVLATAVMAVFNQIMNQKGMQGNAFKSEGQMDNSINDLLLEFFDADKDGSIMDDLIGMVAKFFGHGETRH